MPKKISHSLPIYYMYVTLNCVNSSQYFFYNEKKPNFKICWLARISCSCPCAHSVNVLVLTHSLTSLISPVYSRYLKMFKIGSVIAYSFLCLFSQNSFVFFFKEACRKFILKTNSKLTGRNVNCHSAIRLALSEDDRFWCHARNYIAVLISLASAFLS